MQSSGNTFVNAVVGAVVSLVLVVVPFSPAVGGVAAGCLQRGSMQDGAKVGVVTGLLVAFPLSVAVTALAPLFLFAPAGVPTIPTNASAYVLLASVATGAYALGASTVGAYLAAVRQGCDDPAHAPTGTEAPDATDAPPGRATRDDHGLAED